ncbi:MAG TPA: hypothetical protein VLB86_02990 [Gaiellaceae bacterium]|nr:hypothetical protein [Gaiellaceae bacterium]
MAALGLIVAFSVVIGIVAVLLVPYFTSGASRTHGDTPTVDDGWRGF